MKRLAIAMAAILGLFPGIAPKTAYSDQSVDIIKTRIILEEPVKNGASDATKTGKRDIAEVNFAVRVFLWALDQRQTEILTKVTSPVFRAEFPNTQAMMIAMTLAHGPLIGAKNVFLHTPQFSKTHTLQTVYIVGRLGNHWKATYILKRDENGQYGIVGWMIRKLAGEFS